MHPFSSTKALPYFFIRPPPTNHACLRHHPLTRTQVPAYHQPAGRGHPPPGTNGSHGLLPPPRRLIQHPTNRPP